MSKMTPWIHALQSSSWDGVYTDKVCVQNKYYRYFVVNNEAVIDDADGGFGEPTRLQLNLFERPDEVKNKVRNLITEKINYGIFV